jgi:hypothetical protein
LATTSSDAAFSDSSQEVASLFFGPWVTLWVTKWLGATHG